MKSSNFFYLMIIVGLIVLCIDGVLKSKYEKDVTIASMTMQCSCEKDCCLSEQKINEK
jgi:hypothetical protein